MTFTSLSLLVLWLGVIGPILVAAQVLYSIRKDKTQTKWRQKMIVAPIGFSGGMIGLFIGLLLVGYELSDALSQVLPFFLLLVTVFPMAWFIIMQVQKRRLLWRVSSSVLPTIAKATDFHAKNSPNRDGW